MAADRPTISLQEAGVDLIDCEHKTPPAAPNGYPYVAIPQLHQGRLLLNEARRISREHLDEWTRRARPRHHDVILSRRCNPGETAVVPAGVECAVGQNLVLLRANGSRVYPPFLRWLVRGPAWWDQINKFLNVGAVFDSLRCADVPRFELPIPPIGEQRAIAHILGTLDDKIELNRRMNETLEAMARALFKSWFVDFDPVRAKAAGRQPAGMDAETAALFPSEFVESAIGEIPKEWEPSRLGAAYGWSRDGVDPADNPTATFEHFSLPAFDNGRTPAIDLGATIKSLKFVVMPESVLVSKLNPSISRVWLPFPSGNGMAVSSTEFLVAIPKAGIPRSWLYEAFTSDPIREAMIGQASGTSNSHQRVRPDDVDAIPVALPEARLFGRFDAAATPLLNKANAVRVESARLALVRDALLPRLLSGELTIPSAQRIVGAAT